MKKLSDKQIRATATSAALAQRAIAGDPTARFAIFSQFARQNPEHPTTRAYRTDTAGIGTAALITHPNGSSHVDIPLMRRRCEECVG